MIDDVQFKKHTLRPSAFHCVVVGRFHRWLEVSSSLLGLLGQFYDCFCHSRMLKSVVIHGVFYFDVCFSKFLDLWMVFTPSSIFCARYCRVSSGLIILVGENGGERA